MSEQYTYAVARIRALEVSLFSDSTIEQLIACQNYDQALQFLEEKGWGDAESSGDAEKILTREEEKTWEVVKELSIGMEHFDVLSYPKLFHNLKAAVKEVCTGDKNRHIYYEDVRIPGEEMRKIVEDRDFGKLPDSMRIAGEEAYETLLHTGDGQLCDVIIDRAALDAIYQAGKESPDKIIQDYAESTVAVADIKIAVRSQKTAKSTDFMKRAMAECDSLSVSQLSKAALSGMDAICEYLRGTAYAEGADALAESPSAFERWCDNRIIQTISPEKYHAFTIGPVIAYVIARQNEIKTVRIILSGKQNELPDDSIRERVREMMYKIAVLGDYDSIFGFAALGLDTFAVQTREEAAEKLHQLAQGGYGIIYITEKLAAELTHEIEKYQEQVTPAIIQIPGIAGNTGAGVAGVKKSVEQAVGSDIIFGS